MFEIPFPDLIRNAACFEVVVFLLCVWNVGPECYTPAYCSSLSGAGVMKFKLNWSLLLARLAFSVLGKHLRREFIVFASILVDVSVLVPRGFADLIWSLTGVILPIIGTGLGLLSVPNIVKIKLRTHKSGYTARTIIQLAFLKCPSVAGNYKSVVSFFRV